jgi:hypothetical protein
MRFLWHVLISLLAFIAGSQAQATKPATPPPAASPLTENAYPLPPDRRGQIRDLQYQIDQSEITIQRHQVEIEKLKAQQTAWRDSIADIATDFARIKSLDVAQYEFDQVEVRLVKKKPPAPAAVPVPEKK